MPANESNSNNSSFWYNYNGEWREITFSCEITNPECFIYDPNEILEIVPNPKRGE